MQRKRKGLRDVAPVHGGPLVGGHRGAQEWAWAGVSAVTVVPALNSSSRKRLRKPDERQGQV